MHWEQQLAGHSKQGGEASGRRKARLQAQKQQQRGQWLSPHQRGQRERRGKQQREQQEQHQQLQQQQ